MSGFIEQLDVFLDHFASTVVAGAVTGPGILDAPTQEIGDGMVLSNDYVLTVKTAQFGGLLYNDGITVDGIAYKVREARQIDDGKFSELYLMKV